MKGVGEKIADLYPWIRGVACRISLNEMDGEDLAHDTIVKALLNRRRFDRSKDIKPWLMTIMMNTLKSDRRHRHCIEFCPLQDDWAGATLDMARRYELQSILETISGVAERDIRMRSLLLYAQGYDYGEIAAMTHASIGTVKSRLHYSRKRLKRLLNA